MIFQTTHDTFRCTQIHGRYCFLQYLEAWLQLVTVLDKNFFIRTGRKDLKELLYRYNMDLFKSWLDI
uniref:Uncharacterized protein n=1 Tax=Strongyloides venezuelensis TaxID=75913 RepID=A0A0K0G3B9_STRVS